MNYRLALLFLFVSTLVGVIGCGESSSTPPTPPPAPGAFTLTAPVDAATGVSTVPTFNWGASTNVVTYTLEIATDDMFTNIVHTKTGLTTNNYSLLGNATLSASASYYWRVTAINVTANTKNTADFSFTTGALWDVSTGDISGDWLMTRTTDGESYTMFEVHRITQTGTTFTVESLPGTIYGNPSYSTDGSITGNAMSYTAAITDTLSVNCDVHSNTAMLGTWSQVSGASGDALYRPVIASTYNLNGNWEVNYKGTSIIFNIDHAVSNFIGIFSDTANNMFISIAGVAEGTSINGTIIEQDASTFAVIASYHISGTNTGPTMSGTWYESESATTGVWTATKQ